MNRLLFNDSNFGKLRLFQANTFLHLWSLSNQFKIWKLPISLHRFFLSVADVFLGYWIILVSKCLLPLLMLLKLYLFFLCYTKFIKLCSIALSAVCGCLWHTTMFIVDILSNMSNIIQYKESMTFFFQN